jgi:ABC-type dipeptide/oligopeptide/nickel transport system ATPase subunit
VLEARGVTKQYRWQGATREVLRGVDFTVKAGQILGIHGAAGSGKTTLVRVCSALERPTNGEILYSSRPAWRHTWRGWRLDTPRPGYVLPVFENAVASLDPNWPVWRSITEAACAVGAVATNDSNGRRRLAAGMIASAGLTSGQLEARPAHLSAGQCQRVAILRVIAARPSAVLADEPMSSVDDASSTGVMWLLRNLAEGGAAVVVLSEDRALLETLALEILELRQGTISPAAPEAGPPRTDTLTT